MNIFITDPNPYIAATHLDDVRLRAIVKECAQMLSTATRKYRDYEAKDVVNYPDLNKTAYYHHPMTKWVCDLENPYGFFYAYFYAIGLKREYFNRYGHLKHRSFEVIEAVNYHCMDLFMIHIDIIKEVKIGANHGNKVFENAPACVGDKLLACRDDYDSLFSLYRQCLVDKWELDKRTINKRTKKLKIPTWKITGKPEWYDPKPDKFKYARKRIRGIPDENINERSEGNGVAVRSKKRRRLRTLGQT